MKKLFFPILFILTSYSFAQNQPIEKGLAAINKSTLEGQLEFIASDWMEGRNTGSKGIFLAGDYIKSVYKILGVKPGGDWVNFQPNWWERSKGKKPYKYQSYFQNFSMIKSTPSDEQYLTIINKSEHQNTSYNLKYKTDFIVNTSDVGQEMTCQVVFVGYGLINESEGYNDFEDVDVNGKIVLRLAGFPGHKDTSSAAYKKFRPKGRWGNYQMRKNKNKYAKENGAVGVIEFNPESTPEISWAEKNPLRYNSDKFEGTEPLNPYKDKFTLPGEKLSKNLTRITLSERMVNLLLEDNNIDIEKFETDAAKTEKSYSQNLAGKTIKLKTNVDSKRIKTRNVLAFIEGENKEEVIVVGAHYDHVGQQNGYIWNGSDDNGSGTVGVMTIAKAFMATGVKPKKSILFALWTGEERGLFGSKYFVENPVVPLENIICNVNLDMLSRDADKDTNGVMCEVTYTSTTPILKDLTEKHNSELNFGMDFDFNGSPQPGGGSDHANFAKKDIPVMFFFAGFHDDYHGISDHADKANYDKMEKIVKIAFLNIWEIANMEEPLPKLSENKE